MENNKKIENLLALILLNDLKDQGIGEKANYLNIVGFSHAEIAQFLGTTPAVIKQSIYIVRKTQKEKPSKQKVRG